MESLVTQETHLFHASIAQNLRIAKQDATQEELEQACKKGIYSRIYYESSKRL